jgi:hypothetical protein
MVALAFLAVLAPPSEPDVRPPHGLIGLTCNGLQHLFAALLVQPTGDRGHRLRWSG